jgi:hypothetical protein
MRVEGHTPDYLPPIYTVAEWIHILHSHKYEEFAEVAALYKDDTCSQCMDVSSTVVLYPS